MEISRPQIAANFRAIRQVAGPGVEVMPVVKADAYRHGAIEVSRTLGATKARVGWRSAARRKAWRCAKRELEARILVMADFLPFTREALLATGSRR